MSDLEILIDIPDKVEYTRALFCSVDPPQQFMTIEFTAEGEKKPFRIGNLNARRGPEIAGFVFRPKRNQFARKLEKPLEPPCKITATVRVYESYNNDTKKYGKEIAKKSESVEVIPRYDGPVKKADA